jgi:outer membrane protein OmpA-like peptidoglycan-associated protein
VELHARDKKPVLAVLDGSVWQGGKGAMTNGFVNKIYRTTAGAVLACVLGTVANAETARLISLSPSAPADTRVLFFDVQSASLGAVAKQIVLSAVDAAERAKAQRIEVAAYASDEEAVRDSNLAARRAEVVKQQIANYGFQGTVVIDQEGPEFPLAGLTDSSIDRRVTLRVGG